MSFFKPQGSFIDNLNPHSLDVSTAYGEPSLAQALAPAAILIYATLLYLLAANLFARKDLLLTE